MKLIMKNEFTWDGIYGMFDENGVDRFTISADISDDIRSIKLYDTESYLAKEAASDEELVDYGEAIAVLEQKTHMAKSRYALFLRGARIGDFVRSFRKQDLEDAYDIKLENRMLSGDILNWKFIVVDKKDIICETLVVDGCPALEFYDESKANFCALLMVSVVALVSDLRASEAMLADGKKVSEREPITVPDYLKGGAEGAGLEEAIGIIRDSAEKLGDIAKKTGETSVKIGGAGKKVFDFSKRAGKKLLELDYKIFGIDKYIDAEQDEQSEEEDK